MSFQPGANVYTQGFGSRPEGVEVPHIDTRAPNALDTIYPIGKVWINQNVGSYTLLGQTSIGGTLNSTWSLLGVVGGALNTLTADTGGALTPTLNNITFAGTGSQITSTGSGSIITLSIPSTFLAPGSIASTTTLTAGSSLAVTTSATIGTTLGVTGLTTLAALNQLGTSNINVTGAAVTTIGNVGSSFVINSPTTLTLASGAATGIIINTSAGTGIGVASTSSGVTVPDFSATVGGYKTVVTSVGPGASPQTANGRSFQVIFSGISIAAGASQTIVITNSAITGAATVINYCLVGGTTGSALSIQTVTNSAGSSSIVIINGTGATTNSANLSLIGWIMN